MADVFTPPPDRLSHAHAHAHFSLSEVEENSTEAIGCVLSGQIPSNSLTKAESFPIPCKAAIPAVASACVDPLTRARCHK